MKRLTLYAGNGDNYESINPIDTPYEYGKLNLQKLINKLAEYEDAEEQGLLLRLPCKAGDTVYAIYSDEDTSFVEEPIVKDVSTHRIWIENRYFDYSDIGKTVFLTQAEAEKKLNEMESD